MKIYLSSPMVHSLEFDNEMSILLSYYDLTISPIPFRKKNF